MEPSEREESGEVHAHKSKVKESQISSGPQNTQVLQTRSVMIEDFRLLGLLDSLTVSGSRRLVRIIERMFR